MLKNTYFGKSIRAVGQNREAARLMGISPLQTYAMAFALGATLTGIGASILISFYYVHPTVGTIVFGTKVFIIVVLGGLGSIPGALLGGIIVGVIEALATLYFSSITATLLVFMIFLIILYIRPSGLLGSKLEW
jgi:branched-chain amino acid transport system permease protein